MLQNKAEKARLFMRMMSFQGENMDLRVERERYARARDQNNLSYHAIR